VVFDSDLTIGTLTALQVQSNTTIDGRGRKITIHGHGHDGMDLVGVSNVIVESLTMSDFGDVALTSRNDVPDAIHLQGAHGVWIDHLDLSLAGDKLIDMQKGTTAVTVSWSHLHNQQQNMEVGDYADAAESAGQTMTAHHNWYDHVGYRLPTISYGHLHAYNNFYDGWATYGTVSRRTAQTVLENNICRAGVNKKCALLNVGAAPRNKDPRAGFIRASGNLLENGAVIQTNPAGVFTVPYPYTLEVATDDLAAHIMLAAGPQLRVPIGESGLKVPTSPVSPPAQGQGTPVSPTTASNPPTRPRPSPHLPVPISRAALTVLNNSTIQGLGAEAAARFRMAGWPVAAVDGIPGRYSYTTVYYGPGQLNAARALVRRFPGIQVIDSRAHVQNLPGTGLTVVVTKDFREARSA